MAVASRDRTPRTRDGAQHAVRIAIHERDARQKAVIEELLGWYRENGRKGLPWRDTRDPYKVLVSELMLQQTQVPRVIPKYDAFIARFPAIEALAAADRAEVLRMWQGLGYNNRAVRLHALARIVVEEHDGTLPTTYDGLLSLPGLGPYTAGAVMIFAHNTPAPCVDVNIRRVLARIFWEKGIPASKEEVDALALCMVAQSGAPHDWNSALMDFGSAVCTARTPSCGTCPVRERCESKGCRQDETDASKRQSRFTGSVRWYRGQVLKMLLREGAVSLGRLQTIKSDDAVDSGKEGSAAGEEHKLDAALDAMEKEGLIVRERGQERALKDNDPLVRLR